MEVDWGAEVVGIEVEEESAEIVEESMEVVGKEVVKGQSAVPHELFESVPPL